MTGHPRGIEDGWFTGEIADAAFTYQRAVEKGDKRVVGVNVGDRLRRTAAGDPAACRRPSRRSRSESSPGRRTARDPAAVSDALAVIAAVARSDGNLVEPMLAACRAEATLGEICDVLRTVWGTYTETATF